MAQISTKLTRLIDINVPITCPPMANTSSAVLATEVTLGGGLGFLTADYGDVQALRQSLADARGLLKIEATGNLPIGVGFLTWKLEEHHDSSRAYDMIDAALSNKVKAIWFSFGRHIHTWIQRVRQWDKLHLQDTKVFVLVSSLQEAKVASKDWGADVLVAQGIEAGGHGASYAPPTLSLVTSILKHLPENGPPVVAAGGLSNGSHVAAFLTLGASGAVLGTRFLLTPESRYTDAQRARLLTASAESTVRTLAFDQVRGTLGWPEGIDGRGTRNAIVDQFEAGLGIEELRARVKEGTSRDDPDYMIIWAGTGVGDMTEIKGAKVLVQEMHQEIVRRLKAGAALIEAEKVGN
ncbi:hypothetical protein QCA50_017517 [Cerrena zonata]|uniref:Nitronate monooxygenase domain-containing protein n=1 Tax=Cerrena zonata TaxID=2478898 RepID=A0AAW0FD49_9APHY